MSTPSKQLTTDYYRWDGGACRVHKDEIGSLTADIYRAGHGILPVDATDVMYGGVKISESQYKELVRQEIALGKKN